MRRYLGNDDKTETAFIVTERELVSLRMVQDVGSLLSTGEIMGLFDEAQTTMISEEMMPLAVAKGHARHKVTQEQLMRIFAETVKRSLHLVVCLSPVGTLFRDSVRKFPGEALYLPLSCAGRSVATVVCACCCPVPLLCPALVCFVPL